MRVDPVKVSGDMLLQMQGQSVKAEPETLLPHKHENRGLWKRPADTADQASAQLRFRPGACLARDTAVSNVTNRKTSYAGMDVTKSCSTPVRDVRGEKGKN